MRELCQRFNISPKTGYKWLERFRTAGANALRDRSRRPHSSPRKTAMDLEQAIVQLRDRHPSRGARVIQRQLEQAGLFQPPAISTITEVLRRNGRLCTDPAAQSGPWQRFERERPNELWQMDYKGHFPTASGRCHPLTVLDDHSRYAIVLESCANERMETVRAHLTRAFQTYGMPEKMLMDNGPPWRADGCETALSVWLMRLDIGVSHGRAYHPQTQGKQERFHRTLKAEVLCQPFSDLEHCQRRFAQWRNIYNFERPHQAIGMEVPASRYQPSARSFPRELPELEYGPDDHVRKAQQDGTISFQNQEITVGTAFRGLRLGVRATIHEGQYDVYMGRHKVHQFNLRELA